MTDFGFLTDAFDDASALRARLLARSLHRHDPGTPIGLLAWVPLRAPAPEFDVVVDCHRADPYHGRYRTFNKLIGIGWHSPFARGLFLDNDTVVVAPLREWVERCCGGLPFGLNVARLRGDSPHRGLNHVDPAAVAAEYRLDTVLDPDGGGHYYFEVPACREYFREAIDLAICHPETYQRLVGNGFMSDEVATACVANHHRLPMPVEAGLVQCILPELAASLRIAPETFVAGDSDPERAPWRGDRRIVHFCADGKWSPLYAELVGVSLGARYSRPASGRAARLLGRLASRLG